MSRRTRGREPEEEGQDEDNEEVNSRGYIRFYETLCSSSSF